MTAQVKIAGDGPVVMVDDNETDAFLARRCYDKAGLPNAFLHIESGEGLLDYLEQVSSGAASMPGLILLDINMPGMNGFEALEQVRARTQFRDVPIVAMLTTSDDDRDARKSAELGANGFFTKPSNVTDFVDFFRSLAPQNA